MNNIFISPRADPKKWGAVSQTRPKQVSTPTSGRRILSVPPCKCALCEKRAFKPKNYNPFSAMVTKSLYVKYASSQNYYYTKDINEILADSHTPAVIKFKDLVCYDEEDEYFKRFYHAAEYNNKIQLLTEYYKFHWDIPRLFMMPTTEVLNRFHDKKRRLQYVRVTKMLKDQKEAKTANSKQTEDGKTKPEEIKSSPIRDRVLVDLETSYSILKTDDIKDYKKDKALHEAQRKSLKASEEENILEEFKKDTKRTPREYSATSKGRDEVNAQKKIQKKKEAEEKPKGNEVSASSTLRDLNLKLGEIISNAAETTNLFDRTEQSFNQSISNLKNFLSYLQSRPTSTNNTLTQLVVNNDQKTATTTEEQTQQPQTRPDSAKKTLTRKPSTPRLEKKQEEEEENTQQTSGKSRNSIITWNRRDSVPLVRPSPTLTRRESKVTNEPSKAEEKPKEAEMVIQGHARVLSAHSSSLSSTSTSKSKSVYPSVTRIRNFEEAVKLGQQQQPLSSQHTPSQHKNAADAAASLKHAATLQPTLSVNVPQNTTSTVQKEAAVQRQRRSVAEVQPKNIDLSIKIPQVHLDEKLKDFNIQISPPGSQILSPNVSRSSAKLVKSTVPLSSRATDGLGLKNVESISPLGHSPHFRIKSHREAGTSFDKGQKESSQPSTTTAKQVPLIQMSLSKNGHARFASGGMIPQSSRTPHGKSSGSTVTIQSGREPKGLMPLGTLDIKDIRVMPNSVSRREMLMKAGDLKLDMLTGSALKATDGLIATDREKELTPLTPKMVAATHRDKLISHKHTRSEGGKLKADQLEALMGTINDQKIRELLRLNEGGSTALSDLINKSRKNGEAKNMGSYNMSNIAISSHRDGNYDSAPVASSTHQRKLSHQRISGEVIITPRNVKLESGSKPKGQLKRADSIGSDTKHKGSGLVDREEIKYGKTKTKLFG